MHNFVASVNLGKNYSRFSLIMSVILSLYFNLFPLQCLPATAKCIAIYSFLKKNFSVCVYKKQHKIYLLAIDLCLAELILKRECHRIKYFFSNRTDTLLLVSAAALPFLYLLTRELKERNIFRKKH